MKIHENDIIELGTCWDTDRIYEIFDDIEQSLGRKWVSPAEVLSFNGFSQCHGLTYGNRRWVIEKLFEGRHYEDTADVVFNYVRETIEKASALGDVLPDHDAEASITAALALLRTYLDDPTYDTLNPILEQLQETIHLTEHSRDLQRGFHTLSAPWYSTGVWYKLAKACDCLCSSYDSLPDYADDCELNSSVGMLNVMYHVILARIGIAVASTDLPETRQEQFDIVREMNDTEVTAYLNILVSALEVLP